MTPRTILYTGKGGVGKTSVAASTALAIARRGYRTVVLSTDPAHSLSDSLGVPLGSEPIRVSDLLWGQEVSAQGTEVFQPPRPLNVVVIMSSRFTAIENAWRTRTSLKGGLSTFQ